MDTNTIDLGGLTMEKLFDGIMPGVLSEESPARKINFDNQNDMMFIVGFNLMCMDIKDIKYDLSNLSANTLISIDRRHFIECLTIIAGAIHAVEIVLKIDMSGSKWLDRIKKKMDTGLVFKKEIDKLARSIAGYIDTATKEENDNNVLLMIRLSDIINNIWFLPYTEIDKLKDKINKELSGDNNE